MIRSRKQETEHYKYYNANPKDKLRTDDCAIRAISIAIKEDWTYVLLSLAKNSLKYYDAPNSKPVVDACLYEHGYVKRKTPEYSDRSKMTIAGFLEDHSKGTYVISIKGHLTCAVDGKILDTWNCENKYMGNYWEKE